MGIVRTRTPMKRPMPLTQSYLDPKPQSLECSFAATGWTPRFDEVRRSDATTKARDAWQRKLYFKHFFMGDPSGWRAFLVEHVLAEVLRDEPMALVKNRFPYKLRHAEHHILWYRGSDILPRDRVTGTLKKLLAAREFVWYENPAPTMPSDLSRHFHVFVKRQHSLAIASTL